MKLGIIQGRLSPPIEGYQETPVAWNKEFLALKELGLDHIEWVVTKNNLFTNPILGELKNYPISSVCLDHMIDERIFKKNFFVDNVFPFCKVAQKNNIESITIPIMEESKVDSAEKKDALKALLFDVCNNFKNIHINVEAELDPEILHEIVSVHKNLKITYDTGNITALNFDHELYIRKNFNKITNVHLKDRRKDYGKSQILGKGNTDFNLIFDVLSSLKYKGLYTLQMVRAKSGNEINYIEDLNLKFRSLHEKYF